MPEVVQFHPVEVGQGFPVRASRRSMMPSCSRRLQNTTAFFQRTGEISAAGRMSVGNTSYCSCPTPGSQAEKDEYRKVAHVRSSIASRTRMR